MASDPPALWRVLRADLRARGLSVRRFAFLLAGETGTSMDSWRRIVTEYVREGAPDSYISPERAELFAKILEKPADRYLRPRRKDRRVVGQFER